MKLIVKENSMLLETPLSVRPILKEYLVALVGKEEALIALEELQKNPNHTTAHFGINKKFLFSE